MTENNLRHSFHGAVGLILKKEGKVLLMRRFNTGLGDGMYTLPSGHLNGGETAEEAMSREVLEELGLVIAKENLEVVHVLHRRAADSIEYFDIFLQADKWQGEPEIKEPDKCDDIGWFEIKSLPENTFDFTVEVLSSIKNGEFFSSFGF